MEGSASRGGRIHCAIFALAFVGSHSWPRDDLSRRESARPTSKLGDTLVTPTIEFVRAERCAVDESPPQESLPAVHSGVAPADFLLSNATVTVPRPSSN